MAADILLIAPHPDDIEIGMGGTVAKLSEAGVKILLVDLTDGEPTPAGSPEIRAKEAEKASSILGITHRINLGIKNREIFDTVENRKKLASIIREHTPQIIFAPYAEDGHPDHIEAEKLSVAARFYSKFVVSDMPFSAHYPKKIFHYFSLHMKVRYNPSFVFDISGQIEKKMASISAYHSQFHANPKNVHRLDEIRTEAAFWGNQIGTQYGEPFICKENIRLSSVQALLEA